MQDKRSKSTRKKEENKDVPGSDQQKIERNEPEKIIGLHTNSFNENQNYSKATKLENTRNVNFDNSSEDGKLHEDLFKSMGQSLDVGKQNTRINGGDKDKSIVKKAQSNYTHVQDTLQNQKPKKISFHENAFENDKKYNKSSFENDVKSPDYVNAEHKSMVLQNSNSIKTRASNSSMKGSLTKLNSILTSSKSKSSFSSNDSLGYSSRKRSVSWSSNISSDKRESHEKVNEVANKPQKVTSSHNNLIIIDNKKNFHLKVEIKLNDATMNSANVMHRKQRYSIKDLEKINKDYYSDEHLVKNELNTIDSKTNKPCDIRDEKEGKYDNKLFYGLLENTEEVQFNVVPDKRWEVKTLKQDNIKGNVKDGYVDNKISYIPETNITQSTKVRNVNEENKATVLTTQHLPTGHPKSIIKSQETDSSRINKGLNRASKQLLNDILLGARDEIDPCVVKPEVTVVENCIEDKELCSSKESNPQMNKLDKKLQISSKVLGEKKNDNINKNMLLTETNKTKKKNVDKDEKTSPGARHYLSMDN